MIGKSPNPPRTEFWNLIDGLHHSTTQEPTVIRGGGNSADESVWNPDHTVDEAGYHVTYNITMDDLKSFNAFGELSGSTVAFVADLSFIRGDNASWPAAQVAAMGATIGWGHIHAVSIGNEVDLFAENGLRPANYTYAQSKPEFSLYADAVVAAGLPPKFIRGATWCCFKTNFQAPSFADYAKTFASVLKDMSYHRYPLSHCDGHSNTLADLLQPRASSGQATDLLPYSQGSAAAGLPFVVGESNSAACGGEDLVSNVMGTALWAVDYMFSLTTINATMVNFHGGPNGLYPAVAFNSTDPGTPPDVRPLYYAMRVFAEATANGGRVLETDYVSSNQQIRVWAVEAGSSTTFVVVHKDPDATAAAAVTLQRKDGSGAGTASVATLGAGSSGEFAKYGLHWAGQTFDGSVDGKPVGQRTTTPVAKATDGSYTIQVEPGTVAVVWA
jgi:hypothetical protein